jgi:hypothetical protein
MWCSNVGINDVKAINGTDLLEPFNTVSEGSQSHWFASSSASIRLANSSTSIAFKTPDIEARRLAPTSGDTSPSKTLEALLVRLKPCFI